MYHPRASRRCQVPVHCKIAFRRLGLFRQHRLLSLLGKLRLDGKRGRQQPLAREGFRGIGDLLFVFVRNDGDSEEAISLPKVRVNPDRLPELIGPILNIP